MNPLNNFYNLTATELSAAVIVFNLVLSLILQLAIIYVYKRVQRGLSYSPSFIFTLLMIGVLATVVMMVVQHNIVGAFALLGAFSLIRFRTILKETRDIAFVFFSLAIGVAVGTNNYPIALISTALILLIIILAHRYNIGSIDSGLGLILTFNAQDNLDIKQIKTELLRHVRSLELLQTRAYGVGTTTFVFSVKLNQDLDAAAIMKLLKSNSSITDVELITGEHTVDY